MDSALKENRKQVLLKHNKTRISIKHQLVYQLKLKYVLRVLRSRTNNPIIYPVYIQLCDKSISRLRSHAKLSGCSLLMFEKL